MNIFNAPFLQSSQVLNNISHSTQGHYTKIWPWLIVMLLVIITVQHFMKGWSPDKLTLCEYYFTYLVWPHRGSFSVHHKVQFKTFWMGGLAMKLSVPPVENVNEIHDCCKVLDSHKFIVFACVIIICLMIVIITIMIMIMSNDNNNLSLFYFH